MYTVNGKKNNNKKMHLNMYKYNKMITVIVDFDFAGTHLFSSDG